MINFKSQLRWMSLVVGLASSALANDLSQTVRVALGQSLQKISLRSDNYNADQSYSSGLGYLISYKKSDLNFNQINIELNQLKTEFNTGSALSPADITATETDYQISYLRPFRLINDYQFLKWGVGYTYLNQSAEQTTPIVLIPDADIHALNLMVSAQLYNENDFVLNILFDLGLPILHKEYSAQTGFNSYAYYLKTDISLNYFFNLNWSFFANLRHKYLSIKADGIGSRGTLDTADSRQTFYLPIGVSYDF